MLNLYEQYYVLCLHEEKTVPTQAAEAGFPYWLGAALLAELALAKRIVVKENHRLSLVSTESTGDGLADEFLQRIRAVDGAKKLSFWLDDLDYRAKKVFRQISEQLLKKGVLKLDDEDFGWVVGASNGDERQASGKFHLRARLRELVLGRLEPDLRELALLSLLKASGQLELVFFKDERKLAARWINEQLIGDALQNQAAQTIQEIESALATHIEVD